MGLAGPALYIRVLVLFTMKHCCRVPVPSSAFEVEGVRAPLFVAYSPLVGGLANAGVELLTLPALVTSSCGIGAVLGMFPTNGWMLPVLALPPVLTLPLPEVGTDILVFVSVLGLCALTPLPP